MLECHLLRGLVGFFREHGGRALLMTDLKYDTPYIC